MKTFRTPIKSAVAAAVVLLLGGWWIFPSAHGYLVARRDIARGHYRFLGSGMPYAWTPDYARLLSERYGIEYHAVADCVVGESLASYVAAYNAVSGENAKRKFGHDVFQECGADAQKAWETRTHR